MQRDLVERLGWITQEEYLEGLAVSQTLPGPLAAQLAMWLGYVRRGFPGAVAAAVPFILPPFVIVSVVAALYVAFAGSTVIQALFYGVGPTVIALILRGAWKLVRVTVKNDRRLWAIFGAIAAITFIARSEVAILFVVSGLVGVLLYAPPAWLRRALAARALVPLGLGSVIGAVQTADPNVLLLAKTRSNGGMRRVAVSPSLIPFALAATQTADLNTLVALGVFFFKAGAFTFGSGLAIVPFLQQGVVRDYGWLSEREFLDAVAMGMITPGPVVITAVFVGYLVAGLAGATIAGIGVFLPPFLMVVLFAPWIMRWRKHPAVQGFTKGATSAAAGAIVGAAAVIATQVLVDIPTLTIFALALLILWRFKVPEPALVGASAIAGVLLFGLR